MNLFDPQEACRPLLEAQPGTRVVACCGRCGQVIHGLVALDERGSIFHPDGCPPAPPPKEEIAQKSPQYRLL